MKRRATFFPLAIVIMLCIGMTLFTGCAGKNVSPSDKVDKMAAVTETITTMSARRYCVAHPSAIVAIQAFCAEADAAKDSLLIDLVKQRLQDKAGLLQDPYFIDDIASIAAALGIAQDIPLDDMPDMIGAPHLRALIASVCKGSEQARAILSTTLSGRPSSPGGGSGSGTGALERSARGGLLTDNIY